MLVHSLELVDPNGWPIRGHHRIMQACWIWSETLNNSQLTCSFGIHAWRR